MAENATTRTNWTEYPIEASNSQRRQPSASNNHQQHQIFGPKTVTVHRKDGHGFGFTLRHFIVYPPDSCISTPTTEKQQQQKDIAGALNLTQPMDTVFVKEVRPYGPAHFAGLQTGDRLLSVNGMPVAGTPYNRVVAAIQQAPSTLTLHVVPKECDILQTFFSETAHNPETNQRPQQPSTAPASSSTTTLSSTTASGTTSTPAISAKKVAPPQQHLVQVQQHQQPPTQQQQQQPTHHKQAKIPVQRDLPYARTKDSHGNSINCDVIYSEPSVSHYRNRAEPQQQGEQLQRRRGDEIIQVHHGLATSLGNGQMRVHAANYNPVQQQQLQQQHQLQQQQHQQQQQHLQQQQKKQQLQKQQQKQLQQQQQKYHQQQQLQQQQQQQQQLIVQQNKQQQHHQQHLQPPHYQPHRRDADRSALIAYDPHFAHLISSSQDRRESSASATSSVGSYESGSTLTSDLGDNAIMTRLRKSFEQKEEFLRGGSVPANIPAQPAPVTNGSDKSNVRHREFYARPNRLQKTVWPPNEFEVANSRRASSARDTTPVVVVNNENNDATSKSMLDPDYSPRLGSSIAIAVPMAGTPVGRVDTAGTAADVMPLQVKSTNTLPAHRLANNIAREQFYNGIQEQQKQHQQQQMLHLQHHRPMDTEERMRSPPPGLHMVSERTKQFESGRPLSPDGSCVDRTSLFQSELCRISTKRVVPNVALRRKEFELKANESNDWRRLSDEHDRSTSIEPYELYMRDADNNRFDQRTRSLSVDSTNAHCDSERADTFNTFYNAGEVAHDFRRKPSRQNSYLEATKQIGAKTHNDSDRLSVTIEQQHALKELKLVHRNQTIITGSSSDYDHDQEVPFDFSNGTAARDEDDDDEDDDDEDVLTDRRDRSKSIEPMELEHRSKVNDKDDVEMATVELIDQRSPTLLTTVAAAVAIRPTTLNIPDTNVIMRRHKSVIEDDDRPVRRVSYLRATANEGSLQLLDSDMDNSPMSAPPYTPTEIDVQPITQVLKSAYRPWRRPKLTADIQPLRKIFEENPTLPVTPPAESAFTASTSNLYLPMLVKTASTSKSKALSYLRDAPADPSIAVTLEGELHLKITFIDSKRSPDRSWRTVTAEIRGTKLKMTIHREGKSNHSPEPSGIIDLRSFHVTEGNYTKRKHVFKLTSVPLPSSTSSSPMQPPTNQITSTGTISSSTTSSSSSSSVSATTIHTTTSSSTTTTNQSTTTSVITGTELLIQADSHQSMKLWMDTLRRASCIDSTKSLDYLGGQTAEPQRIAATTIIQTAPPPSATEESASSSANSTSTSVRKYLGSRSPSGQSPVTKSRKTPQYATISLGGSGNIGGGTASGKDSSDKEIGSPKSRTWKGLVARQFRKIQGQPSSPNSNYVQLPDGASIGVPLAQCPMSDENQYVPFLIARCTHIVESKGLSVVGIYRIPGNTAAISALTEQVNRGFDEQTLSDEKWNDVNVVSSLLKLFIRSLPDGLLPNDMYNLFIEADKESGHVRILELKSLLERLPAHSYETLKHLMRHLFRVSQNCLLNLMEPKNLAIIFGPSVVRTSNETLETVVKDMKHQCRIVEALVSHYEYFFENASMPLMAEAPEYASVSPPELQTNLLLDNLSKIEQRDGPRFVSKFVQAATTRKARKTAHRKSTLSSVTPDSISLDSSTSAESKDPKMFHGTDIKFTRTATAVAAASVDEALKIRLSEDESNDSAFTDNGSMSLTTVTLALDDKLRSLRNSSFDSDKDIDLAAPSGTAANDITSTTATVMPMIHHQPLSLGENIPYADESPERPLIQSRSKPVRISSTTTTTTTFTTSTNTSYNPTGRYNTRLSSQGSMSSPPNSPQDMMSHSSSQENVVAAVAAGVGGNSNHKPIIGDSSDDTDASTTSNAPEKFNASVIREMSRILTTLERKATKLNRSLSLNYKNHKGECCCNINNNNNVVPPGVATVTCYRQNNRLSSSGGGGSAALTKDEKTDKNINKKRQLQDGKNHRRYTTRSIKRRHTVGGTHDYDVAKSTQVPGRCQQGHNMTVTTRASSPDLAKDNNNQDKGAVVSSEH